MVYIYIHHFDFVVVYFCFALKSRIPVHTIVLEKNSLLLWVHQDCVSDRWYLFEISSS